MRACIWTGVREIRFWGEAINKKVRGETAGIGEHGRVVVWKPNAVEIF